MIVIAALHVTKHGSKERGIIVYFYRKADLPPLTSDGNIDVIRAHEEPGELVYLDAPVKPGGNSVSALLDFVSTNDNPPTGDVLDFLRGVRSSLSKRRPPLIHSTDRFGIHFNANIGLYHRLPEEFDALAAPLLKLIDRPPTRSLRDNDPLTVLVRTDHKGVKFDLDDEARERLQRSKGNDWTISPVHIDHQTLDDIERIIGRVLVSMATILTRLDEQELLQLGGVKYVDALNGRVLAQWPSRKKRPRP